jgi:hypothetical protein
MIWEMAGREKLVKYLSFSRNHDVEVPIADAHNQ